MTQPATTPGELILYTDGGATRVQVRLHDGSVWLTQKQMAALYAVTVQNVGQHLQHIYADGELAREATLKYYFIVQTEGGRLISRQVEHYSLPAILAVGYRVRSTRGTVFRQWATAVLQEYAVKGFALDDARLKSGSREGPDYFDELLARIRDIRSSERVFWRKVLDIYATSVDYDPRDEASRQFFRTVQNKMHWAAHGHTAAEVIRARADADQPNMGLRTWTGHTVRRADVEIAKNYLNSEEIDALNRIVNAYLEFAELQALNRKPMTMAAWITKLDDFLRLSDREVLKHAGQISHDAATEHAATEYDRWVQVRALPEPVDLDFEDAIRQTRAIAKTRAPRRGRKDGT